MTETQRSEPVSTTLARIAELARRRRGCALTTLAHHIDIEFLREAYRRTRKDAAPGIDGETAETYAVGLEDRLRSLWERFHSGRYRAPAVRRVQIPKGDGRMRPIGIPTFEDKILQRAVAMVLEAVYEQEFRPSSFGFRPGRSAHQALEVLWREAMAIHGGWVLEVDLESFFDSLDHAHLRHFLDQRVRDGVLRRAIDKWLKAGVLEEGRRISSDQGTPQGGVISPLLANLYLHHVLDQPFEQRVRPRLRDRAILIRYADDFVILFAREEDARWIAEALPRQMGRYGLRLHPEKTRLVRFRRPRSGDSSKRPDRPGAFDFLGFTHYWGRSRSGRWVVQRKTASSRQRRALRAVHLWLKRHRHLSIPEQQRMLARKIQGHCAYYGITGNAQRLSAFRFWVIRSWIKWLRRRSQRGAWSWERFRALLARYPLPQPVVVHSIYRRRANP